MICPRPVPHLLHGTPPIFGHGFVGGGLSLFAQFAVTSVFLDVKMRRTLTPPPPLAGTTLACLGVVQGPGRTILILKPVAAWLQRARERERKGEGADLSPVQLATSRVPPFSCLDTLILHDSLRKKFPKSCFVIFTETSFWRPSKMPLHDIGPKS